MTDWRIADGPILYRGGNHETPKQEFECLCGNREFVPISRGCPSCGRRGKRHPTQTSISGGEVA